MFSQNVKIDAYLSEGSIRATLVVVGSLYAAIAGYGSLRSGIDYLIDDAKLLKSLFSKSLVRNGLPEELIIDCRKLQSTPDRVRLLLLRIDRLENGNFSKESVEYQSELKRIKQYTNRICWEISDNDKAMLVCSINQRYIPEEHQIASNERQLKFFVRDEDLKLGLPLNQYPNF
ncbi:hypothetical protein L4C31_21385 [Aliivibrio sifiae]